MPAVPLPMRSIHLGCDLFYHLLDGRPIEDTRHVAMNDASHLAIDELDWRRAALRALAIHQCRVRHRVIHRLVRRIPSRLERRWAARNAGQAALHLNLSLDVLWHTPPLELLLQLQRVQQPLFDDETAIGCRMRLRRE